MSNFDKLLNRVSFRSAMRLYLELGWRAIKYIETNRFSSLTQVLDRRENTFVLLSKHIDQSEAADVALFSEECTQVNSLLEKRLVEIKSNEENELKTIRKVKNNIVKYKRGFLESGNSYIQHQV